MRKVYTGPFNPQMRLTWIDEIVDGIHHGQGTNFIFILPTRHLLHKTRRQILEHVGGVTDLRLLTFDDIAHGVLAKEGVVYRDLSRNARIRLLKGILQDEKSHPLLTPYRDHIDSPGLIDTILYEIGEWKRKGMNLEKIEGIVADEGSYEQDRLLGYLFLKMKDKLSTSSKSDKIPWLDPEDRLQLAATVLQQGTANLPHPYLEGIETLYMDHFTDFTVLQINLLEPMLRQIPSIQIYTPYQTTIYDGLPLLKKETTTLLQKMEKANVEWEEIELEVEKAVETDIVHLQKHALQHVQQRFFEPTSFEILAACDQQREIEIIGKECKRILVDFESSQDKVKPSDIAIVIRNPQAYQDLLHHVFSEEGIPLNFPEQQPLLEVPIIRGLFSLFNVYTENWSRSSVLKLVGIPYFNWESAPPFGLEKWAMEQGIVKGYQSWISSIEWSIERWESIVAEEHDEEEIELVEWKLSGEKRIAQLLKLKAWLQELNRLFISWTSMGTSEEWVERIQQVLKHFRWDKTLISLLKTEGYSLSLWKRDRQALTMFTAQLQEILDHREWLSKQKLSCTQFISELRLALSDVEVTLDPGQGDGVLVLDPSSVRGDQFHTVFIVGLNEGSFPRVVRESWWENHSLALEREMEMLFFHMAIGTARKKLIFSYVSPEANENVLPSPFLEWVMEHYDRGEWLTPPRFGEALTYNFHPQKEQISCWQEFRRYAMASSFTWAGEHDRFARIYRGIELEQSRRMAPYGKWDGKLNDPNIHERLHLELNEDRPYSVSFINEYASSPLKFFFNRILRVKPIDELEHELTRMEEGDLFHFVLQGFYSQYRGRNLGDFSLDDLEAHLESVFHTVMEKWEGKRSFAKSNRWHLEKERMLLQLKQWLNHEISFKEGSNLLPTLFEFSFGLPLSEGVDPDSRKTPIVLKGEEGQLYLYGKMDRIDYNPTDHSFVIYDYKLRTSYYRGYKDVQEQLNFQLPLYLLAFAEHLKEEGKEGLPLGAGFYSLHPNEFFAKKGMWDLDRKEEMGFKTSRTAGLLEDLSGALQMSLHDVLQLLHELRHGSFQLLPKHKLDRFYGNYAQYQTDERTIMQKYKQVQAQVRQATQEIQGDHVAQANHDFKGKGGIGLGH